MSTGRESPAGSEESDLASGKSRSVAPDDIFNNFPRNDEEVFEGMAETVPMPTPLPRSKLTEEDLQMTRLSRESIFPPRTQAEIARASAEIARRTEELREDLEAASQGDIKCINRIPKKGETLAQRVLFAAVSSPCMDSQPQQEQGPSTSRNTTTDPRLTTRTDRLRGNERTERRPLGNGYIRYRRLKPNNARPKPHG